MDTLNALQIIISIITIVSVGYVLSRILVIDEKINHFMSMIIMNIAIPSYLISSIPDRFSKALFIETFRNAYIPFIVILTLLLIGYLSILRLDINDKQKGAYLTSVAITNSLFIGLPENVGLFGEKAIPYVFICFLANMLSFWTIGAYLINNDGRDKNQKQELFSMQNLKHFFSLPIIAFIAGIIFVFLDLPLPTFLQKSTSSLGDLMTPLSLIYIGFSLKNLNFDYLLKNKSIHYMGIVKFGIGPLVMFALVKIFNVPEMMGQVFIIQTIMPSLSVTGVLSKQAGGDSDYANNLVMSTLIIVLFILTIYILFQ